MSERRMTSKDKEIQRIEQRRKEVELMVDQIDMILLEDDKRENYEECAKLLQAKLSLQKYLDEEKEFEEIKDNLYYVKKKFSLIVPDALRLKE